MFFDEDECLTAIECVHTQHTLRTIKSLFENKDLIEETFLFIIKPNILTLTNEIEFILPQTLWDKVGYILQLKHLSLNDKYVKVYANNSIDLWLLFKLYHKEASYYILKDMEYLFDNKYVFSVKGE